VIDASGLSAGAVNYIIKRLARRAGLEDDRYGAHSLRSSVCAQAAMFGGAGGRASDRAVMKQSGHTSLKSLDRYVRLEFSENAAASLGL
jgi:integrase